jgi:hypothetical protein
MTNIDKMSRKEEDIVSVCGGLCGSYRARKDDQLIAA